MIESMKPLFQRAVDGLAAVSLVFVRFIVAVWISRALPLRLWIPLSIHPFHNARHLIDIDGDPNVLVVADWRSNPSPVESPIISTNSDVKAFRARYGTPVLRTNWARFKTGSSPIFSQPRNRHISMLGYVHYVLIPYVYVLALFFLLPAWRWLPATVQSLRSRFATPPGHCKNCGYDLRASLGRCPECGSAHLPLTARG